MASPDPEAYFRNFTHPHEIVRSEMIRRLRRPRDPLAYKNDFGHAWLIAGSRGKIGAALLAARACLRAGAGLLTVQIPGCGYGPLQTALPEAMVVPDDDPDRITNITASGDRYTFGLGPGLGTDLATATAFRHFLEAGRAAPMVIDADGLNLLAREPSLLSRLPENSILTPHPGEFERLFGKTDTERETFLRALEAAGKYRLIVVLKGHFTAIAMPGGHIRFNSTGNAGMAKGGSGDALTGIVTALLAQHYEPGDAATLGVYLHGLAGDIAADAFSEESMLPSDLIEALPLAFRRIAAA